MRQDLRTRPSIAMPHTGEEGNDVLFERRILPPEPSPGNDDHRQILVLASWIECTPALQANPRNSGGSAVNVSWRSDVDEKQGAARRGPNRHQRGDVTRTPNPPPPVAAFPPPTGEALRGSRTRSPRRHQRTSGHE